MTWKRLLAFITGSVEEQLILQNEYLLTDSQRISLAKIGKRLGRKALQG